MYECLVLGKCLDNAELEDFHHHASHTLTLILLPPAKKYRFHGPLDQALAKERTGKTLRLYSRPFVLIPGPLPPLETALSFFSWASGFP